MRLGYVRQWGERWGSMSTQAGLDATAIAVRPDHRCCCCVLPLSLLLLQAANHVGMYHGCFVWVRNTTHLDHVQGNVLQTSKQG